MISVKIHDVVRKCYQRKKQAPTDKQRPICLFHCENEGQNKNNGHTFRNREIEMRLLHRLILYQKSPRSWEIFIFAYLSTWYLWKSGYRTKSALGRGGRNRTRNQGGTAQVCTRRSRARNRRFRIISNESEERKIVKSSLAGIPCC